MVDIRCCIVREKHGTGTTTYILATCQNCGAVVTMTMKDRL